MAAIIQFYKKFLPGPIEGGAAVQGREVDYVRIEFPGDRNTIVDRRVKDQDKLDYQKSWEAYSNQEDQMAAAEGIPLSAWPAIDASTLKMLKSNKVYTVDALVEMTDIGLQNLGPGMRELQKQGKAFLENTSKENLVQKEEIDELKAEIAEMKSLLESATAPKLDKRSKAYKEMMANDKDNEERQSGV